MNRLLPKLFPTLAILLGLYWIVGALEYGLWIRKGPGGGFMPVFAGIATILFAVWVIIGERNEEADSSLFSWQASLPIVALVAVVLSSYVIGLLLSIAVFIILWLTVVEHHKMKFSLITGFVCIAILYGIFVAWLQVPLPLGLFEYIF